MTVTWHGRERSPWLIATTAVLVLMLLAIVGIDMALRDVVVFSFLNLPVVLSAGLGSPRITGLLAGVAIALGLVDALHNDYLASANGWVRLGLMLAFAGAAVALSLVVHRMSVNRDIALLRLEGALQSELDAHVFLRALRDRSGAVRDLEFVDANQGAGLALGRPRSQLLGRGMVELFPDFGSSPMLAHFVRLAETGEPLVLQGDPYRNLVTGESGYIDLRGVRVEDTISVSWRDVTEHVESARALAASEEHFRLLAENASDIVMLVRDRRVAWISPSVQALTGTPPELVIGEWAIAGVVAQDMAIADAALAANEAGEATVTRTRSWGSDGSIHWLETTGTPYYGADGKQDGIITRSHVIDDLVRAEEELAYAAHHDALTGLLNRGHMLSRLGELAAREPRTGTGTAAVFCDVDNLKPINDEHGHAAGDRVLRAVAERILASVRHEDQAARMGGDEFLVVLAGVHDTEDARAVAEKIRSHATEPVDLGNGEPVRVTMSIGVAMAQPGEPIDQLVERADAAMYQAKRTGRDTVVVVGA